MNILDEIIAVKHKEIERRKQITPVGQLEDASFFNRNGISLKRRLAEDGASGIIAEFKRSSPSKGIINDKAEPDQVAKGYQAARASGMSVLTDSTFFGGSSQDILTVRETINLPILRKDFIIDAYQVYETKALGADVLLLIAANLEKGLCTDLSALARDLDLEVLLEIHTEEELDHINDHVTLVGINNRNLKTFEVDTEHSIRLCEKIDDSYAKIAESGLSDIATIKLLRSSGFSGFLIGEYFMKQNNPGRACAALIQQL